MFVLNFRVSADSLTASGLLTFYPACSYCLYFNNPQNITFWNFYWFHYHHFWKRRIQTPYYKPHDKRIHREKLIFCFTAFVFMFIILQSININENQWKSNLSINISWVREHAKAKVKSIRSLQFKWCIEFCGRLL